MRRSILLFMLGFLLAGCATGYHPLGMTGGYYDEKVGTSRYLVGFNGNAFTSDYAAQRYAFRHAKEICEENGYYEFELVQKQNSTSVTRMPSQINCHSTSSGLGVDTNCSESPGARSSKPQTELIVECFDRVNPAHMPQALPDEPLKEDD